VLRVEGTDQPSETTLRTIRGGSSAKLLTQPAADHRNYVGLLLSGKDAAPLDTMPLCQTAAAAGGGGVLRHKHRVTPHRSLLAIVLRLSGREPLRDEVSGVGEYRFHSLGFQVCALSRAKLLAPAERRPAQGGEEVFAT
jgi:hypothetical protein